MAEDWKPAPKQKGLFRESRFFFGTAAFAFQAMPPQKDGAGTVLTSATAYRLTGLFSQASPVRVSIRLSDQLFSGPIGQSPYNRLPKPFMPTGTVAMRWHRRPCMKERWLSIHQIVAHLGVNRDTIYKWIERRKMPAHKVGRLWKFLASEVDLWVKHGRVGQTES